MKNLVATALLLSSTYAFAGKALLSGPSLTVPAGNPGFTVTQNGAKKQYSATFSVTSEIFGQQVQNALPGKTLVSNATGGLAVWSHVPVVTGKGVVFKNVKLAPMTGNGGSSTVHSTTVLKPLNAHNASAAVAEGISFFGKTTDGATVWLQGYGNNAKLSQ